MFTQLHAFKVHSKLNWALLKHLNKIKYFRFMSFAKKSILSTWLLFNGDDNAFCQHNDSYCIYQ